MLMLEIFFFIIIFLLVHYVFFLSKILYGLNNAETTRQVKKENLCAAVIIPFRNESENILKSLESLQAQNYSKEKFEIIFVDDSSEDDSLKKISEAKKNDNVRVLSVPKTFQVNAHKKRAIIYGIENSTSEIIITTDADCLHKIDWLQTMINEFDAMTGFVSGPVIFLDKNSFFEKLQKLEFAGLVLTGAGLINAGTPVICNAANLAYRRKVFEEVNGFNDQMNLSSGDDELLMQKIYKNTNYKIKFCWNKSAVVKTKANKSYSQFYQQRKRWASKGLFYEDKVLILKLILIFLYYLSLPVLTILAFIYAGKYFTLLFLSAALKIILEYLIIKKGKDLLQLKKEMKYFLIAEVIHLPYILVAGFSGVFGNYVWKNRTIKR
jgi:cellulose synthase/poly-beta-1,6-N-acetylglucosamine synthase-like glycosyltransferase